MSPLRRAAHPLELDMPSFDPASYGDSCAEYYDQLYPSVARGQVEALEELSRGGLALELGLATGRVALPLAARGVEVHGVEASPAMLGRFRFLPRASSVRAVAGDFSRLPYRGPFRLVFSLVGTLGLLPSRRLQASCLREVARVLEPGGTFVSEAHDLAPADQASTVEHAILTPNGARTYRVTFLPTPPTVLDGLASAAGLSLRARWSGWSREPWDGRRPHHVSLYRKAEATG